jgi:S1/P1 Nuclease
MGQGKHDLAAPVVYQNLSDSADLEQAYISQASRSVQDQLLLAGVRLARILDENFN